MLILLSHLSIILLGINHASATSCHELHQSQLISLNERMNQMIDTISSLLPKPLKKPKTPEPLTVTPPVDYSASAPSNETPYTSPIYTPLPQAPQITYVTPSYSPVPAVIPPSPMPPNSFSYYPVPSVIPPSPVPPVIPPSPVQPNSFPFIPGYYSQIVTGLPVDYAFPTTSNLSPGFSRLPHPYEIGPNPIPVSNPSPLSYPPIPISHIQQYPIPPIDYNRASPPEYSLPAPVYPNTPYLYSPVLPPYPLPVFTMQPPRNA